MSANPSVTKANLLGIPVRERPNHVFLGDQRAQALKVLGTLIAEQRGVSVMQLVNKDPSLALESVPLSVIGSNASGTTQTDFALACLRQGLSSGYLFAIAHGLPVDAPLMNGTTTLLQAALEQSAVSDVSLLLSMGASSDAMTNRETLYAAVAAAYPAKGTSQPGAVLMMLDAQVRFDYPDTFNCPYSVIVKSPDWKNPDAAAAMTRVMAKFVKSGLSLDRETGTPRQTPIARALGSKNGAGLLALIRLGAKSDPAGLNGADLFAVMKAQGLEDFVPGAQAALMEAHISRATRSAPAQTGEASPPRRRRLGAL